VDTIKGAITKAKEAKRATCGTLC